MATLIPCCSRVKRGCLLMRGLLIAEQWKRKSCITTLYLLVMGIEASLSSGKLATCVIALLGNGTCYVTMRRRGFLFCWPMSPLHQSLWRAFVDRVHMVWKFFGFEISEFDCQYDHKLILTIALCCKTNRKTNCKKRNNYPGGFLHKIHVTTQNRCERSLPFHVFTFQPFFCFSP